MSNERPILFNDEMIRAILEGRKTQTRRIVKGIDHDLLNMMSEDLETGAPNSEVLELLYGPSTDDDGRRVPDQWLVRCTECPEEGVLTVGQGYGNPGDRLWVQEVYGYKIRSVGGTPHEQVTYRATDPNAVHCYDCNGKEQPLLWCPAKIMPRNASRITLEITSVRIERLQDISGEDSAAEGVTGPIGSPRAYGVVTKQFARDQFMRLWESINGPDSWQVNPWVWAIEFERVGRSEHV